MSKLCTLDLNKDVLLLASRSIGSFHSVEAFVCTIRIPDKQRGRSRYIDDVHHLFGNFHTISVPDNLWNRATSDGHLQPDVVSCLDCQALKVFWAKLNVWSSWLIEIGEALVQMCSFCSLSYKLFERNCRMMS